MNIRVQQCDNSENYAEAPVLPIVYPIVDDAYFASGKITKATSGTGHEITFTKISEAKVGDEVYIIVAHTQLKGEPLEIQVLQGEQEVLVPKDQPLKIQRQGKETTKISVKGDHLDPDPDGNPLTNAANYCDQTIVKVTLGPKANKDFTTWNDKIAGCNDVAELYLKVDAHTANSVSPACFQYNGLKGFGAEADVTNRFLNQAGGWFGLEKIPIKNVVVFFIGGAADKKSYWGIPSTKIINEEVAIPFSNTIKKNYLTEYYKGVYLGFDDVRGKKDIKKRVLSEISDKHNTAVYIVGHSLGGWNGAHLTDILSSAGYKVKMLITLDPVGKGTNTQIISDVYWLTPEPETDYWINITTNPQENDIDDYIADLGMQWNPEGLPEINDICACHHRSAHIMFNKALKDTDISASDMLLHNIKNFLER